jgi:hypothetical protein
MQLWADVYDPNGNIKVGQSPITDIISASITRNLDGAGNIEITVPPNANNLDALVNERQLWIYAQADTEPPRLIGTGYIRKRRIVASASGMQMSISGPDLLDALRRKSVLLGRIFDAQAIGTIASDLIGLIGNSWQISLDTSISADTQTARFDGATILKALIRIAEEKGAHIRAGLQPKTVELGTFGSNTDLIAIEPPASISIDMYSNDNVLLVDRITQIEESDDVVNWIIPIGAGEGSAAQTLKESTRTGPYPIQTMTAPDGRTLYYLANAPSVAAYGEIQRVVTFKEIGPIANSTTAKTLAANALYDAAVAWLQRNSEPLTTYQISVKKCLRVIRPGDKIRLIWNGSVQTAEGDVVPIDVDNYFWVMRVTETVNAGGMGVNLQISSIDRVAKDAARLLVGALESISVTNVSVQTFPFVYQDSNERVIQGGGSPTEAMYRAARFSLRVNELFTDIVSVKLRFITQPLFSTTDVGPVLGPLPEALLYDFGIYNSPHYPCDIRLSINNTDVTEALGGPWNPGGGNLQVDTEVDITTYILNSPNGMFSQHSVVFTAGSKTGEGRVNTSHPSSPFINVSNGTIEAKFIVLGAARAILP